MKKVIIILFVALAFGFSFIVTQSYAARAMRESRNTAYVVTGLLGAEVENPMGVSVGSIHDFVIDSNGHIDFVILRYDFPSEYAPLSPKMVAVPFNAIKVEPGKKIAVLKFSGWKLELAPEFVKSDINNHKWTENDFRYFGVQPYWTEGRHKASMDPYRWGGEAENF